VASFPQETTFWVLCANSYDVVFNTYSGSVMITGPNGATQTVNIAFSVSAAMVGNLNVSAPSVSLSTTQGSGPTSLQLTASNQGGGSIAFTARASVGTPQGGNWLQVSPMSGTVTPTSSASLMVTATPGTLPAGTYSGTIVVTSVSGVNYFFGLTTTISPDRAASRNNVTGS